MADRRRDPSGSAAIAVATVLIAVQVATKATRNALFLSTFPVTRLPGMVVGAALLSIVTVVLSARAMAKVGPARFATLVLYLNASLFIAEWILLGPFRGAVAILFYLHFNALGALLVSAFWTIIGERFDPRTAKRQIGRIAAAGTAGGFVGGLLAERVASLYSVAAMFPVLAAMAVWCALALRKVVESPARSSPADPAAPRPRPWTTVLAGGPYLRLLLSLVLLVTVVEGLTDYVFKAYAVAAFGRGEDLMRLFAIAYAVTAAATFLLQTGLSRRVLEILGLGKTVATLPATVATAALGLLILPGLAAAAIAWALEGVLRGSLYRSGYELLFTPIPREEKRAAKPIIDVGVMRLGDVLAGGLIQVTLLLGSSVARGVLPVAMLSLASLAIWLAYRLQRGYVLALRTSLLTHAVELEPSEVVDDTTRSILRETISRQPAVVQLPARQRRPVAAPPADPVVRAVTDLRSANVDRVRAALRGDPIDRTLSPFVIPLLGWDQVTDAAASALRKAGSSIAGQLVDALLDPDEEFTVRRRIPAILATLPSARAVDGLIHGLDDPRFEVRYRCGRGLLKLQETDPSLEMDQKRVTAAVLREVSVDGKIWHSQRLLDRLDDEATSPLDQVVRQRASRSLEHVFSLLRLLLPQEPLGIAFRALYTEDQMLRGTALEYLESTLPDPIRERLWPFLEEQPSGRKTPVRPRAEIVADLMRSNASIAVRLSTLPHPGPVT